MFRNQGYANGAASAKRGDGGTVLFDGDRRPSRSTIHREGQSEAPGGKLAIEEGAPATSAQLPLISFRVLARIFSWKFLRPEAFRRLERLRALDGGW